MVKVRSGVNELKVYRPGKPIEEVERELGISDVMKMASNENPLGPSPLALEAIQETLGKINLYPDGNGYYLKQDLARHWGVEPEQVVLGNGSDEIVQLIAMAFINEGDEAIMATPSFPRYEPVVRLMGGVAREVPLKDHRHDLEAMAALINEKTRLIFICNPNNPTGTIVTKDEVKAFLARVPREVIVVFDEAYFEYVQDSTYPDGLDYLRQGREVIVLRTFSKAYGLAGLRVGYALTTPEIADYLNRVRPPFNVDMLAQVAARAALKDREFLQRVVTANEEGKQFFYRELERRGIPYIPTWANFLMLDTGVDSVRLFQEMLRRGVIVRSGDIFAMPTWIRVTVGRPEENERFFAVLDEVLPGLRK
ncbi:MAG: histidinol-phosphate aminotransferase [Eubacteriales bacterium]|nr:histidinol-phosphate aminotransferase [Eubacteriales bacterium]